MTLANWARECTGEDPAPDLRGKYSTDSEWLAIVESAGCLTDLVGQLAIDAGMVQVSKPCVGDIGIIRLPHAGLPHQGSAGAIKTLRGWTAKLHGGLLTAPARHLAVWGFR